ncbi:enoyl-CoA hydratase/isomerase family protein [Gordonia sp. zg691]|uniref:enoyl-CoA hydratase/isomerase family protein n=1 Tax=Gordonia jinghuaiqii TaxID=2758710 RepID=UPI001662206E|nr:enoyl-CoA hydratase/isomerase family protein [Gordonia jinghuaiqii]MBD0859784.1 enoyl-CoA hydratase/isomerase family protein [Gordonia jinghuaiqii]
MTEVDGAHPKSPAVARSVDDVLHIALTCGDTNNTLGPVLVRALREALRSADRHNAVLLTAEGRNFCAGGDHDELGALGRDEFRRYLADLAGLFADLANSPVPQVVAVHRAVVGGGLELCLLADFVVASDDAWFRLPQVALGGRIGKYSYSSLVGRCGLAGARRLVMLGERIEATDALELGLIDDVVTRAELDGAALRLAQILAARPSRAMRAARAELANAYGVAQESRLEATRRTEAIPSTE